MHPRPPAQLLTAAQKLMQVIRVRVMGMAVHRHPAGHSTLGARASTAATSPPSHCPCRYTGASPFTWLIDHRLRVFRATASAMSAFRAASGTF